MNLTFSAHALDRCFERRISLQGVLDALRQGTCVKGNGMKDGERFVMAHGRLKVVAEFEGPACVVISAWRDQRRAASAPPGNGGSGSGGFVWRSKRGG